MRRKISLYIADKLVDLDEQSFILFNYTMEDLRNPTIVRNSFSQQVTLPGTPNNNKIFGGLFRLDRSTVYGSAYVGAEFDTLRRTPFVIYSDTNEIVESGYMKMDGVVRQGRDVQYKISLFGGIGSFFYNLSYLEDGTPKKLVHMRYQLLSGAYTTIPGHMGQVGGYQMCRDAWGYLADPDSYDINARDCWWANIINFAPCYNGLPDKFSADKAVCRNAYANIPDAPEIVKEGDNGVESIVYSFKEGTQSNLLLFSNAHSEWEVRDLRWYLQRPVMSVKSIIDAICDPENNGGYSVELSSDFFSASNTLYWKGWVTLPMIPAENRSLPNAIPLLLASMKSPAEYLISFAKIFGLVFRYDASNKKVSIMTRTEFYTDSIMIDMTERIDRRSINVTPVLAQSRFYQFGGGAIGAWAEEYKNEYGEDYAIQKVNTGSEFNSDVTEVTKDIIYKDAVEVQERSLLYVTDFTLDRKELFTLPKYEGVTLQVWGVAPGDDTQSMEEYAVKPFNVIGGTTQLFYNLYYPLSDWLPKAQFHDKNLKSIDAADVLLVFDGMMDTPTSGFNVLQYRLSDDTTDMMTLNENTPCWNFTSENVIVRTSLPSFRRCSTLRIGGYVRLGVSYEWGEPKSRGVNGVNYDSLSEAPTIYNRFWKKYQSDRYDADTFTMICKVDLRGLQVGQNLLCNFYFYEGAVFVLNRIINHSLTTWDDTECEFIKVQDISNYNS